MRNDKRATIFIASVAVAGAIATSVALWIRPALPETSAIWLIPTLVILLALAGRFPFKLSSQTESTLFTVPLFMGVILLPPIGAILAGALGSLMTERLLRSTPRVLAFNVANTVLSVALASIVFMTWTTQTDTMMLTPALALAALAAGLVLHGVNLMLLLGMVILLHGVDYWRAWRDQWKTDVVQEGALITLGLIGALVTNQAGWGLLLLLVPFVLGYFGFKRSVEEAVENSRLAQELQQNLKELKETQAHLVQSAKLASVGTLAAGVAHEINNPVFAVTGRAEIFLRMLKNADEEYLHSEKALHDMEIIMNEGVRIASIVRHLLDYARNSDEVKGVRLDEVIDSSLALLAGKISRKGIKVVRDIHGTPVVNAVPNRLEQVFMNLIVNSMDAMPSLGTITIGCEKIGDHAVCYVKDTGDGIPDDVKDRIFEPFFTTKGVGNGTGLGMFICHRIIEEFGGTISVDSEQGIGTKVTVSFPLSRDEDLDKELKADEKVKVAAG